jgi:hypothetical protein
MYPGKDIGEKEIEPEPQQQKPAGHREDVSK